MTRFCHVILMGAVSLLLAACSERDRSDAADEDWSGIQALGNDASVVLVDPAPLGKKPAEPVSGLATHAFEPFVQQLAQMKSVERQPGETVMTAEMLVFDYEQKVVRMDRGVVIQDDQGTLETEGLVARLSVSNRIQQVNAVGGVTVRNKGRIASAEEGVYRFQDGSLELRGKAEIAQGGSRASGERIQFWNKGDRRIICEPNALFVIADVSEWQLADFRGTMPGETEIRADRVVYDESKSRVELNGHVRLRDAHVAMNCGTVRVFLKDTGEIDWIEASDEVIIVTGESGARALADRAAYYVAEGKFMLEGTPMIQSGGNVMTGDRISFWHKTRQMICEPNARVLLYLDEETNAKFMKDLDD